MCGRFVSTSPPDEIAKYFGADAVSDVVLEESYNVAPTNDVYAVLETGGLRRVEPLHWGLVPIWAKDLKVGNRMINARGETLADRNAYKRAYRKRRCLIPADGFYEWKRQPGRTRKQPFYIHRADDEPLAFAGLWETWRGPDRSGEEVLRSTTIVTGPPNDLMAEIHDRMPVILPPAAWGTWLDPDEDDLGTLGKLLVPAPSNLLAMHTVSTEVNNVRNKGAGLIDEVDAATDEGDGR